jgi:hypothetical protein
MYSRAVRWPSRSHRAVSRMCRRAARPTYHHSAGTLSVLGTVTTVTSNVDLEGGGTLQEPRVESG